MARLARNEVDAGVWHVWARGVERRVIFGDDDDRRFYVTLLQAVVSRFRWWCLGYCLMPNHVHLVIETHAPNLGRGMHSLHGVYAQHFNERWKRVGHLFQSRFGSRPLHDEHQLGVVLAYVAANPVAANLCERPDEWPWSSHPVITSGGAHPLVALGRVREHLEPLGPFDPTYREFVDARLGAIRAAAPLAEPAVSGALRAAA